MNNHTRGEHSNREQSEGPLSVTAELEQRRRLRQVRPAAKEAGDR